MCANLREVNKLTENYTLKIDTEVDTSGVEDGSETYLPDDEVTLIIEKPS